MHGHKVIPRDVTFYITSRKSPRDLYKESINKGTVDEEDIVGLYNRFKVGRLVNYIFVEDV